MKIITDRWAAYKNVTHGLVIYQDEFKNSIESIWSQPKNWINSMRGIDNNNLEIYLPEFMQKYNIAGSRMQKQLFRILVWRTEDKRWLIQKNNFHKKKGFSWKKIGLCPKIGHADPPPSKRITSKKWLWMVRSVLNNTGAYSHLRTCRPPPLKSGPLSKVIVNDAQCSE